MFLRLFVITCAIALEASCTPAALNESNPVEREPPLAKIDPAECPVHQSTEQVKTPDEYHSYHQKTAIALSGGGYRAMLFHVGSLRRLAEKGILDDATTISSVSGGSIAAGILATSWDRIRVDGQVSMPCFDKLVVSPAIELAARDIDISAITLGLLPGSSASARLNAFYEEELFGSMKLVDLPKHPKFIFNATNLQTGAGWRFMRQSMGDDTVGYTDTKDITLALAVTASSAYPPWISPVVVDLSERQWTYERLFNLSQQKLPSGRSRDIILQEDRLDSLKTDQKLRAQYNTMLSLADGGLADNLGLVSIEEDNICDNLASCKPSLFILSNGGAGLNTSGAVKNDPISEVNRLIEIIYSQPAELRSIASLRNARTSRGYYLACLELNTLASAQDYCGGYNQRANDFGEPGYRDYVVANIRGPIYAHSVPSLRIQTEAQFGDSSVIGKARKTDIIALSEVPTRLSAMDKCTAMRIINWGYLAMDNAMPFDDKLWADRKLGNNLWGSGVGWSLAETLPFQEVGLGESSSPGTCSSYDQKVAG